MQAKPLSCLSARKGFLWAEINSLCFLFIAVTASPRRGIHCDHWFPWSQCKSNSLNTVLENGGGSIRQETSPRGSAGSTIRSLPRAKGLNLELDLLQDRFNGGHDELNADRQGEQAHYFD